MSADGLRTEVLPEIPRLGALYRTALARFARLQLVRPRGGSRRGGGASAAGGLLPQVAYEVRGVRASAADVAAYQRVVGEPGLDVLPAGFIHVLGFPLAVALMVRDDFPLPALGVVHLSNEVHHHRAVAVGDVLDLRAWAREPRAHRRGTQFDLALTASVGGEVVWEGVSTYLSPGRHLPGLPAAEPPDSAATTPEARAGGVAAEELPTARWRLSRHDAAEYAEVSGDRNPIHTSRVAARLFGFPRPIAHGMYTAARALAAIGPRRGEAFTWQVSFAKPVRLPGTVDLVVASTREGAAEFTGRAPRGDILHFTGAVTPLR
ncbi:MAG TPA: MaoC/PaaZ C-terminal domain-containing protein [Actinomycetaceae bacterium]|nr:MaoC/PaaZ C-terminal domain-containing protein [Actinomycetaceae bacterium]